MTQRFWNGYMAHETNSLWWCTCGVHNASTRDFDSSVLWARKKEMHYNRRVCQSCFQAHIIQHEQSIILVYQCEVTKSKENCHVPKNAFCCIQSRESIWHTLGETWLCLHTHFHSFKRAKCDICNHLCWQTACNVNDSSVVGLLRTKGCWVWNITKWFLEVFIKPKFACSLCTIAK